MEKIQEILFENKEKIPDGVYLELMNNLKLNADKYYKIEYVRLIPTVMFDRGDDNMDLGVDCDTSRVWGPATVYTTIVPCDHKQINDHNRKQFDEGKPFYCASNYDFFNWSKTFKNVRHKLFIRDGPAGDDESGDDDECDDDVKRINITTCFKITPSFFVIKTTII